MGCDGARLFKPWLLSAIAAPRMLSGGAVLVQLGRGSGRVEEQYHETTPWSLPLLTAAL